jgi:hypothetical protein
MAQLQKLIGAFKACSGPYPWRDFALILSGSGYEQVATGKTAGSRRRYVNKTTGRLIYADEPHNGVMGPGMVRRLRRDLQDRGVI